MLAFSPQSHFSSQMLIQISISSTSELGSDFFIPRTKPFQVQEGDLRCLSGEFVKKEHFVPLINSVNEVIFIRHRIFQKSA